MGNVIDLAKHNESKTRVSSAAKAKSSLSTPINDQTAQLLAFADKLDAVIVDELRRGILNSHDIAGIVAHRLGTLMRHIAEKPELWHVCEKVAKKQAAID